MELNFPSLPQRRLEFQLSDEAVRAWPSDGEPEVDIAPRFALGEPMTHPLDDSSVTDPAMRATIAALADKFEFQAVFLSVTFRTEDKDPPFEKATVELLLSTVDGITDAPVALSMTPQWVVNPATVSRTLRLSPELTFSDIKMSLASAESSTTRTDAPTVIRAYGQQTSNPSWRFAALPGLPLDGVYELALTVKRIRGTAAQATVRIEPYVRHRNILLRFVNKPLPPLMLGARL
jgi:hypothetical protein